MSRAKILNPLPEKAIQEIPLELLEIDPMNVRGEPKVDNELIESLGEEGTLQNVIIRPVDCVEQTKIREELRSKGKQFVVTAGVRRFVAAGAAGLETLPCKVMKLTDLEAQGISIAENVHRRNIPEWKLPDIITDYYKKFKGSKTERVKQMKKLTGLSKGSIFEYLTIKEELAPYLVPMLKEPEERSDSETEVLSKRSTLTSKEMPAISEKGQEKPPFTPRRLPVGVAMDLARDKDFQKLQKSDPSHALEIAVEAAEKGRKHIGQVLRKIRERPKRERAPKPETMPPVKITGEVCLSEKGFMGLERYMEEYKFPDPSAAATEIVLNWIRREANAKYVDFSSALSDIVGEFLERKRYVIIN